VGGCREEKRVQQSGIKSAMHSPGLDRDTYVRHCGSPDTAVVQGNSRNVIINPRHSLIAATENPKKKATLGPDREENKIPVRIGLRHSSIKFPSP